MRPLPLLADDNRPVRQDYQTLCNSVDGKIFCLPLSGEAKDPFYRPPDPEYLKTVDPKKAIAFEYETGYVGFVDLFKQIQAAHLSTQEIINVVTAADERGPYSTDDVFELKYDLAMFMPENAELMEWLGKHPSRPPEGWPETELKVPAPV